MLVAYLTGGFGVVSASSASGSGWLSQWMNLPNKTCADTGCQFRIKDLLRVYVCGFLCPYVSFTVSIHIILIIIIIHIIHIIRIVIDCTVKWLYYVFFYCTQAPPTVTVPPEESITAARGGTVTFTCSAIGVPVPIITWRLNWGHIPANSR